MKSFQRETSCSLRTNRRTDRQTEVIEANSRFLQFCDCAQKSLRLFKSLNWVTEGHSADFISALVRTQGREEYQHLKRWTAISKTSHWRFPLNVFEQSRFSAILYAKLKCKYYHLYGQDIRFEERKNKTNVEEN